MVTSCDLSLLANDLYALQKFQSKAESGGNISSHSVFERKIWLWFDALIGKQPSITEDSLQLTLIKVKAQFLRCLDEQELLVTTIHIDRNLCPVDELTNAERELLSIGTQCLFLTTHVMLLDPKGAISTLQQLYIQKTDNPFLDSNYLQKLERFTRRYAQVAIAAILERSYPTCCFSKFIQQLPLDYRDRETLHKWVKALEKNKTQIRPYLLHLALTAVVEGILPLLGIAGNELSKNVSKLEWRLYCGWSAFIGEPDQSYEQWINKIIVPQKYAEFNGKQLLIGKKVEFSLPQKMAVRFYELPEDPTSLLLVGCNPASLGIWQINDEFCGRAGPLIQVKEKDLRLGCFVVERVNTALVDMLWQTVSIDVDQADALCLQELARLISWFVTNGKNTPKNLSIDHVYFQKEVNKVKLRLLMPFDDRGDHDFARIERFTQECAKNNRWVYRYLARASGLTAHPKAIFIRSVAMAYLLNPNDQLTVLNRLNADCICDPQFIDQVESMLLALHKQHTRVIINLQPHLKSRSLQDELTECVAEALIAHQELAGYTCTIDPGLQELSGRLAFEQKIKEKYERLFS